MVNLEKLCCLFLSYYCNNISNKSLLCGCFRNSFYSRILCFVFLVAFTIQKVESSQPCSNPVPKDESWRSVSPISSTTPSFNGHCDKDVFDPGTWYTFSLDNKAAEIPTSCIKGNSCGASISMRINLEDGSLPIEPGVNVTAFLCGAFNILDQYDCCVLRTPVIISRCPDNSLVYNFPKPFDRCSVAVCVVKMNESVPSDNLAKHGENYASPTQLESLDVTMKTITEEMLEDDADELVEVTMQAEVEPMNITENPITMEVPSMVTRSMEPNNTSPQPLSTTTTMITRERATDNGLTNNLTSASSLSSLATEHTTLTTTINESVTSSSSSSSSRRIITTISEPRSNNSASFSTTSQSPLSSLLPDLITVLSTSSSSSSSSQQTYNTSSTTTSRTTINTESSPPATITRTKAVTNDPNPKATTPTRSRIITAIVFGTTSGHPTKQSVSDTTTSVLSTTQHIHSVSLQNTSSPTAPPLSTTSQSSSSLPSIPLSNTSPHSLTTTGTQSSPTESSRISSSMSSTQTTTPGEPEVVMTEMVRLVFSGIQEENMTTLDDRMRSLVRTYLLNHSHRGSSPQPVWVNVLSLITKVWNNNQTLTVDMVIAHSMDRVSLSAFRLSSFDSFIQSNTNLTLVTTCRPSKRCGEQPIKSSHPTQAPTKASKKSGVKENLPVLIAVLCVCALCIVVMATGVICAKCRHRGVYTADSKLDVKHLQDKRNYFVEGAGTASPFTDSQIMKDEEIGDGSFSGSAMDGGADKDNSWVVPLHEIDLDNEESGIVNNGLVATETEDTQF